MFLTLLLLVPAELDTFDSKDFPKEAQIRAVTATVRVVNAAKGEGSGVLVGRNGPLVYVLTAVHVVAEAKRVEVNTYSARSHPKPAAVYRAEVIAQADLPDLALLRFATHDEMPGLLRLCPPARLPEGREFAALSVGATQGQAPSPRLEDVKGPRRVHRPGADGRVLCWETAQAPAKGRSGGPLLDRRGSVIGLDSGAGDGKGYYVHVEEIHAFLKKNGLEWLSEEKPER
jgi:S1-C subfamily serine protease